MDTKVTFQKTSCYFCAEWLDDKTIKDHLTTCGQVLEKCPYNCMSYVQRKNMEQHFTICAKREKPTQGRCHDDCDKERVVERLSLIEENLMFLRKSLNEEIQMRLEVIGELGALKRRNQITDEWTVKVSEVLNLLQKRIEEEKESRLLEVKDFHGIIDSLLKQFQDIKDFRNDIFRTLDNIETKLKLESTIDTHEASPAIGDEWHSEFKRLESEMNKLKFQTSDDMNDVVKYIAAINDKLNQVELVNDNQQSYNDDNLMLSITRMDKLENDIVATSNLLTNLSDRFMKCDYSVKQLQNTINEIEDKADKVDKNVETYKELVYATKQSLADLKEHLKVQRQLNMITNIRGHLIWKVSNYTKKLNESRESDVPLRSPLFSNKQYGYALRLDIHLNGIGTWKNRNLIACLTVVNGDYDTLLQWPCKLKADIILRDQPDNLNDATDITKLVITKKRNDKLEYQNQFIHIPHQMINSGNYIKNDAIILEVKVQKTYEANNMRASSNSPKANTPTHI